MLNLVHKSPCRQPFLLRERVRILNRRSNFDIGSASIRKRVRIELRVYFLDQVTGLALLPSERRNPLAMDWYLDLQTSIHYLLQNTLETRGNVIESIFCGCLQRSYTDNLFHIPFDFL